MRLIDADALKRKDDDAELAYILDNAPTVDAKPVVRCRECKYCEYDALLSGWWCRRIRDENGFRKLPNWYCADGERKDNE